jgi:hypothetical protein
MLVVATATYPQRAVISIIECETHSLDCPPQMYGLMAHRRTGVLALADMKALVLG